MSRHLKSHSKDAPVDLKSHSIKKKRKQSKKIKLPKNHLSSPNGSLDLNLFDLITGLKNSSESTDSEMTHSKSDSNEEDGYLFLDQLFKKDEDNNINSFNLDLNNNSSIESCLAKSNDQIDSKFIGYSDDSSDLNQSDLIFDNQHKESSNSILVDPMNESDYLLIENRTANQRFHCKICKSEIKSSRTLRRHLKFHQSNGQLFRCLNCDYKSLDSSSLIRHLRTHNGERPYMCTICEFPFTTKANCERHVRKIHIDSQKSTNSTDNLALENAKPTELSNPLVKKRPIRPSSGFVQANSILSSEAALIPHLNYEPSNDETVCRYCLQDFTFNRILKQHLKKVTKNELQKSNSMVNLDELSGYFEILNQPIMHFSNNLFESNAQMMNPLDLSKKNNMNSLSVFLQNFDFLDNLQNDDLQNNDLQNDNLQNDDLQNDNQQYDDLQNDVNFQDNKYQINSFLDIINDENIMSLMLENLKTQTASFVN